jgi:uncharacterized protein YdeI (BOF family)
MEAGLIRIAIFAALCLSVPAIASAAPLTSVEDIRRNSDVTVNGSIDRITDEDEFILRDATGTVRVYVGPNRIPAPEGSEVTVVGFVDDDLRLEIYAREMVLPDGTRVAFEHRY